MEYYTAQISIYLCGLFNAVFALFHFTHSPYLFFIEKNEQNEKDRILVRILSLSVGFLLLMLAYLLFINYLEMSATILGRNILLISAMFWLFRLLLLLFFDPRKIGQKILFSLFLCCGIFIQVYSAINY